MLWHVFALSLVLSAGLSGCSGRDEKTETAVPAGEPQHVWKDQVQALDKARQVEQTLMDANERRLGESAGP